TPHSAEFPYCDGMLQHAVAFRQLARALGGCEEDAKYTLRCILVGVTPSALPRDRKQRVVARPTYTPGDVAVEVEGRFHWKRVQWSGREAQPELSLIKDTQKCARQLIVLSKNRFTDITKFPKPVEPRAVMMVAALEDLYVDPDCAARLHAAWPGSVLRWVQGGHVSAFLQRHTRDQFRAAIVDALNMLSLTRGITSDLIEPDKPSFTNLYR
ncbi:hypothetical protein CYMTET_32488, partial [Cymbomonas tetramitiformis]